MYISHVLSGVSVVQYSLKGSVSLSLLILFIELFIISML